MGNSIKHQSNPLLTVLCTTVSHPPSAGYMHEYALKEVGRKWLDDIEVIEKGD